MIILSQSVLDAQVKAFDAYVQAEMARMQMYVDSLTGLNTGLVQPYFSVALYEGEWWVMQSSYGLPPAKHVGPFMTRFGAENALEAQVLTERLVR
jgi:hypothetical protein